MTSRNIKPYSARPDHSVLRPCIEVANSGMKQAIYAMKCGSKEVTSKNNIHDLLHNCERGIKLHPLKTQVLSKPRILKGCNCNAP